MRESRANGPRINWRKIINISIIVLILCYTVFVFRRVSKPGTVIEETPSYDKSFGSKKTHDWKSNTEEVNADQANIASQETRQALQKTQDPVLKEEKQPVTESILDAAKRIQQERQLYMWRQCNEYKGIQQNTTYIESIPRVTSVNKDHPIMYCPLQKVASSFWVRMLTVVGSNGKYTNPFDITVKDRTLMTVKKIERDLTERETETFVSELFTFMFVRCPYSRLFSAYVDKVYFPNTIFWPNIIDDINKEVYGAADVSSFMSRVTFSDFIKYILKMSNEERALDKHFAAIHTLCDPCAIRYNFIGKLETFIQDTEFLLNKWRNKFPDFNATYTDLPGQAMLDDIKRHVAMLFEVISSKHNSSDDLLFDILNRGWLSLKLRGYIDKDTQIPYKKADVRILTMDTFLARVLKISSEKPLSDQEARNQRSEALVQAYRTISKEDLEKIRLFVLTDCQLFDYDDRPAKVFDRKFEISAFDYFQDIGHT